ncbi:DDE-type integrase/transposase/recombinase, partial [Aduncisulcus paluster]
KHVPTLKGPFRIVSFERSKFVLKPLNGDKEFKVPHRRLRKYAAGEESVEELRKISAKDEDEFIVEKILSKRYGGKKKIEFKVRWAGYGPEEDQWLPWSQVKDLEAMDKFLEANIRLKNKIEDGTMNL